MKPIRTAVVASLLVASSLVAVPSAAQAATSTGAVTVMLITPSAQKLPLAGAAVAISGPRNYYRITTTSAAGRATFSGVPVGSGYTVLAAQEPGQTPVRLSAENNAVTVVGGSHVWVALKLRLAGSVSGRVLDQNGAPAAGRVYLFGLTTRNSQTANTDAAGNYTVRGLYTDDFRVTFFSADGRVEKVFRGALPVNAEHGDVPASAITGINTVVTLP